MENLEVEFYCDECKGLDVKVRAWINPNTVDRDFIDFVEEDDGWCNSCDKTVIIKMKDNTI